MAGKPDQFQLFCSKFTAELIRKCQIRLFTLKRRIMYKGLFSAFEYKNVSIMRDIFLVLFPIPSLHTCVATTVTGYVSRS